MATKPNFRFDKRQTGASRQRREAEKQNGPRNKRGEATPDSASIERPPPPQAPATALAEQQMLDEQDVIHLANEALQWRLCETAAGNLTDGVVPADLRRDVVHQIVQWIRHLPERLPEMEAPAAAGRATPSEVREMKLGDGRTRW